MKRYSTHEANLRHREHALRRAAEMRFVEQRAQEVKAARIKYEMDLLKEEQEKYGLKKRGRPISLMAA